MLVREQMSAPPVTVAPSMNFSEALRLMRHRGFRRLPVVDGAGRLVGIVSERDLLYASPSSASSLTIWELNYLLSEMEVSSIMTRDVLTVEPETSIEDAARIMVKNKIGGLPVIDHDQRVVGIISETDIFTAFLLLMGERWVGDPSEPEVEKRRIPLP